MNLKRVIAHTGLAAALMMGAAGCVPEKEDNNNYDAAYENNSYAYDGGVFAGVGWAGVGNPSDQRDIWVLKPGGFAPKTYELVVGAGAGFAGWVFLWNTDSGQMSTIGVSCPTVGPTCWYSTTLWFGDPNADYAVTVLNYSGSAVPYVFRLAPVS